MVNASVEPQPGSFSDATCQRLTQLLLRCLALDAKDDEPAWFVTEICRLQQSDNNFADWWDGSVPLVGDDLPNGKDHPTVVHCAATIGDLVFLLTRRLVSDRRWQALELIQKRDDSPEPNGRSADGAHNVATSLASILLDVAHLAIRLHGFEYQFEQELQRRSQQSLYNFAYGLSHELNNPLANIATRAGVLAQEETSQHRRSLLHAMVDNAMRGCEMLGDLMLIARPPAIELQPVLIAQFLAALVAKGNKWVEQRAVTMELQVEKLPADRYWHFDPSAITEALWALIRNGVEAMTTGGRLTICTSICSDITDGYETAAWLVIEIVDEGRGLSPQALNNCFDPYYSGREAGRGLGVGLTKAQRLVTLHHGRLTLANRTDRPGCRAVVKLPSIQPLPS